MTSRTLAVCIRGFRPHTVGRAIVSALAESDEVVVTDDAGSLEHAVLTAGGGDRVRYVRNPRRLGPSLNAQAAVAASAGDAVIVLGDDDALLPGFREQTLGALDANPDAGAVFVDVDLHDCERTIQRTSLPAGWRSDPLMDFLAAREVPSLSATVFRRSAWDTGERLMPMPGDVAADVFAALRTADMGRGYVHLPQPLVARWATPGRLTTDGDFIYSAAIAALTAFSFSDHEYERLRRQWMAFWLRARAVWHLSNRKGAAALADVRHAGALDRRPVALPRHAALQLLSRRPGVYPAARAAFGVGRRLGRMTTAATGGHA
jgi:glycosyltransferase involved in cell wall biosynthesis